MIRYSFENNKIFEMRPLCVRTDPQTQWNYLLGYSRPYQSDLEWRFVSVRVSRISKLAEIKSRSGKITREEQHEARKKIDLNGIAYVLGNVEDIKVRLTDRGMQRFDMTLHLRPYFEKTEDPNTIIVKCTPKQAEDYFRKFSGDVEIVSPGSFGIRL